MVKNFEEMVKGFDYSEMIKKNMDFSAELFKSNLKQSEELMKTRMEDYFRAIDKNIELGEKISKKSISQITETAGLVKENIEKTTKMINDITGWNIN